MGVLYKWHNAGPVYLNGRDNSISLGALRFGREDFFVGMKVKFPENGVACGDLIGNFDPVSGKGWGLTVNGSSGGYCGISDQKNLYFGIDDGFQGAWGDCGAPCTHNTLVSSMCAYNDSLYVGIADGLTDGEACRVYKYDGGKRWVDCGRLGGDPKHRTAFALTVHQGKLYASAGVWDYERALGRTDVSPARVFCYEGGTEWLDCGQAGTGFRIMSLASNNGSLYAGTDCSEVYRYIGDTRWEFAGGTGQALSDLPGDIFRMDALTSFGGELYGAGKYRVYKHGGVSDWECVLPYHEGVTQIHKLQVYGGKLYAGTWPCGKVLRFEDDGSATDTGELGDETRLHQANEVNDMVHYNGKLYAGAIPKAELYRYDGDGAWKMLRSHAAPDYSVTEHYSWRRITSMAVFDGKLFFSPSTALGRAAQTAGPETGNVFTWESGVMASCDAGAGTGWRHIAACKQGGRLSVYVDGELKGASRNFDPAMFDLDNDIPLQVGFGTLGRLRAEVGDVIIIGGEFDADALAKEPLL